MKHLKKALLGAAVTIAGLTATPTATAQNGEQFIGQLIQVGFNFCPREFALANGQLLPIAQNQALFSLLGTSFGGDGRTTFALPDLRGRVPIHNGQGTGLSNYNLGQRGGTETTIMTTAQLPSHNHIAGMRVVTLLGDNANAKSNWLAQTPDQDYSDVSPGGTDFLGNGSITVLPTGGGVSESNIEPFLAINYCVAMTGIFPSRN